MRHNQYDDERFFEKYGQMNRSLQGLAGAGEWPALRQLLPGFTGRRVLDLGCGYGWHCRYAMEQGAKSALGIDLSEKMLEAARQKNGLPGIEYRRMSIEEIDFPAGSFDVAISSLALHYVADVPALCRRVYDCLTPGGDFVFSIEHPIFTAQGPQQWLLDAEGNILCWPVDRYFAEGERHAVFLGEPVTKQHHTLTTLAMGLLDAGFAIRAVVEPQPTAELLAVEPAMAEELRRPMMLLFAAGK